MFEITTQGVGLFIIILGVSMRRYLLAYFKKESKLAHVLYIILLLALALPFYFWQYRLTFTSLNAKSAKALVTQSLQTKILNKYRLKSLQWSPCEKEKNLYNIKASVTDTTGRPYFLYMQPTCHFFKGCQVGLDKIIVLDPNIREVPLKAMSQSMFSKRNCADKIITDILKQKSIEPLFKALFTKWESLKNSQAHYKINTLNIYNEKQSNTSLENSKFQRSQLNNVCQAEIQINGIFTIQYNHKDISETLLSSMFDHVSKVVAKPNSYIINTKLFYNIYTDPTDGSLNYSANFVDLQKMKKSVKKIATKKSSKSSEQ